MFHLLAYSEADTAGAANEDINGVTDNYATLQNNHYILQQDVRLMAAYARNAGLTNARINTPKFRFVGVPSIFPFNRAAAVPTLPPYQWLYPANLVVPRIDEIAFEASNNGAGGIRTIGGLWVAELSHTLNIPQGDMYTLRFTSTITQVANTWTMGTFTFEQSLPAGNFTVIGLDVNSTNTEFARLAFQNNTMRPGVLTYNTLGNYDNTLRFRNGHSGVFGTFPNTAQPNLELFGATAGAQTVTGWMDVVKTG